MESNRNRYFAIFPCRRLDVLSSTSTNFIGDGAIHSLTRRSSEFNLSIKGLALIALHTRNVLMNRQSACFIFVVEYAIILRIIANFIGNKEFSVPVSVMLHSQLLGSFIIGHTSGITFYFSYIKVIRTRTCKLAVHMNRSILNSSCICTRKSRRINSNKRGIISADSDFFTIFQHIRIIAGGIVRFSLVRCSKCKSFTNRTIRNLQFLLHFFNSSCRNCFFNSRSINSKDRDCHCQNHRQCTQAADRLL